MNRKHLRTLRAVHIVSLVLSILLVIWSILCLLLKVESAIEWIILLFVEGTIGIPGSIYALQDISKTEKHTKEPKANNTEKR